MVEHSPKIRTSKEKVAISCESVLLFVSSMVMVLYLATTSFCGSQLEGSYLREAFNSLYFSFTLIYYTIFLYYFNLLHYISSIS